MFDKNRNIVWKALLVNKHSIPKFFLKYSHSVRGKVLFEKGDLLKYKVLCYEFVFLRK